MIEEIHFILHVVNGIHIIILNFDKVYLHVYIYKYYYNYLFTCTNTFCQFLENGIRYIVEIFSINLFFNGLSNDISHFVVT